MKKMNLVAASLAVLLLSGCGETKDADTAKSAATEIISALETHDPELLKTRLSEPDKGLQVAWLDVGTYSAIDSKVEGDLAKVRMRYTIDADKKDSFDASMTKYLPDQVLLLRIIDGKWKFVGVETVQKDKEQF
ncbi:MAG: hypothetical protein M1300_04545 [Epsilonproteobacteria bacterium]|nr:hypothetical protein [Campylobacterota bacterium]